MPSSKASMQQRERDYQSEDDFRTLERADEVRSDKSRHQRAVGHGRKRMGAIKRVIGARAAVKRAPARRR